jgi:hypothetical protein
MLVPDTPSNSPSRGEGENRYMHYVHVFFYS